MGVFLYYFPGFGDKKAALTREDVAKTFARESLWDVLHTASRFAHNTLANVVMHGGPDNGRGTLLTCQTGNEEIPGFLPAYLPEKQTWKKIDCKDGEPCWLGWYNDPVLRPKPEHLLRLWPIDGEMVELGDGSLWKAPVIRTVPRRTITLPKALLPQDDGTIACEVKPEFAEFLTLSDEIWDHYWGIKDRVMDDAAVLGSVIKCLNLNYRVSLPEVNALRLLDSENWAHVFRASNNFELIEELMGESEPMTDVKKKDLAPDPSAPSAGTTESTATGEV